MNEEGTWTKAMSTGYFLHLNLWFLKNFSRRASLTVLLPYQKDRNVTFFSKNVSSTL